ncbi:hypothetical protein WR25_04498 isoform F [Diploscapter pachys]|nr:hypothetical protein WR25_04498 isoform F [Diploscapter pachys]
MVMPKQHTVNKRNQKCMGFFLQCCPESTYSDAWSVHATAEMRMLAHLPTQPHFTRKTTHTYTSKENDWGYSCFMTWADIVDESQGYIKNDKVTLEITVKAEPPKNMMNREEFCRVIVKWYDLAEMQLSRGQIDLSIEANNQALKFCKDKDKETKEKLEQQKERIVNQKLLESIQRIEKGKDAPKTTEALKPTSLRQALTGAQKTLSGKMTGKAGKKGRAMVAVQQMKKKKDGNAQNQTPQNQSPGQKQDVKKEGSEQKDDKNSNLNQLAHHGQPENKEERLGSNSGTSGSKSKRNKDKKGTDKSAADQQNTPVFEEAEGEKFENFENAPLPEHKVSLASPYCVQSTSYDKSSPGQNMTSEQANCPCFACHPEQSSAFYASLTATRTATRTTIVHEQGTLSYMKTICDGEQDPNCVEKCDCITCQLEEATTRLSRMGPSRFANSDTENGPPHVSRERHNTYTITEESNDNNLEKGEDQGELTDNEGDYEERTGELHDFADCPHDEWPSASSGDEDEEDEECGDEDDTDYEQEGEDIQVETSSVEVQTDEVFPDLLPLQPQDIQQQQNYQANQDVVQTRTRMEEQLSEEEARRIKEFVDLHFSMDKSVFPVDMKVTDEMMATVSMTVNNLMQEKLQMINDDHGMCCLAAGLFYVIAKRVVESSTAFVSIVEGGLVPNISDIHCLFATMCSLTIKDSDPNKPKDAPGGQTGNQQQSTPPTSAKQKQQLLHLLSQQKTSIVAQKAALQRQQDQKSGGRRIAKARRRVSPAIGRLSKSKDEDSENEDEELGGVSDEDPIVPTRTREFFANLSTKQDVMAMVKGRIALMKENPLNKTPGLRYILIQLYKYISNLTTVCDQMEMLEAEASRAKESMIAIDGSKMLEQFHLNEKRMQEMEKRCNQMKTEMQKETEKIKKIETMYNQEKAKHKAEVEAKDQLQMQLKEVRKQLTKAEKKHKQDENRINTLQQENTELDEKNKNLRKEFEAFKKKVADERTKTKKDKEKDTETIRRLEQEVGDKESERDREKQVNDEAHKQTRMKEQKWERERRQYTSQLSAMNVFVERAKQAECQLMENKYNSNIGTLQKAREEAQVNLAEAEENLKKATTHADMELMRRSVAEWTQAVQDCEHLVQSTKHTFEQAIDAIRKGIKTMVACQEECKIPEVPVMPKIVRLPPVQVVQPVAPVIPPQGVIGQPRTSQQNRVRDSSPRRQQSSSPSASPTKAPQPSSCSSTSVSSSTPMPALPAVSANANVPMPSGLSGRASTTGGYFGSSEPNPADSSPWSWGSGMEFNRLDVVRHQPSQHVPQTAANTHSIGSNLAQQQTQGQQQQHGHLNMQQMAFQPAPIGTARQSSQTSAMNEMWAAGDASQSIPGQIRAQTGGMGAAGWTNSTSSSMSWNPMSGLGGMGNVNVIGGPPHSATSSMLSQQQQHVHQSQHQPPTGPPPGWTTGPNSHHQNPHDQPATMKKYTMF